MRTRPLVILCALCAASALLAPSADAASKPRPIRVVAKTKVGPGPALAGGRVVWVRQSYTHAKLAVASRRSRQTAVNLDVPRFADGIRVDDVAASPLRAGYAGAEEYFDVRDALDGAYFFGTFRSRGTVHESFGRCVEQDRACFGFRYRSPHVETTGNAIAWGPYADGTNNDPRKPDVADNILVKDYTPGAKPAGVIVKAQYVRDFKMAGRFLAYSSQDIYSSQSRPEIVLIDWKANQEVRRFPVQRLEAFDVDRAGRVVVASSTNTNTLFDVYDARGTGRTLGIRSPRRSGEVWIANGRIALRQVRSTNGKERAIWLVTTLSGRTLASMRQPSGATLTDFDGSCLAWSRSQRAIYVAAVGKPPRRSICRR
jgi:hypothetical protein